MPRFNSRLMIVLLALTGAMWLTPRLHAQALKVGDNAPQLYVSQWLNGDKVEKFEEGKVYIIECWATWCGPCRAAIPHVTELQNKFRDKGLVVIGLNVWEDAPDKVKKFVEDMGEKMSYVVALDEGGQNGKSSIAWLAAAGQDGIPCSFVVDQKGKIAWIGHPMNGMDKVVEQVLDGTYDAQAAAGKETQISDLRQAFGKAMKAGNYDEALATLDKAIELSPESADRIRFMKVNILLANKKDYDAGYALAKELVDGPFKDDAQSLNELAWFILDDGGLEKVDTEMALKSAQRAAELTDHNQSSILDTLALACFMSGDLDEAIKQQQAAIDHADQNDKNALGHYRKNLRWFEQARAIRDKVLAPQPE
ncbi:MAG: redoxin family protein [Phycisphaera sp.]|nr:redoxin family protein [Phycisphaera sp.]